MMKNRKVKNLAKFISMILLTLLFSYIGGFIQANSHFIDINDIAEITECQEYMLENCNIPPKILALYFVPHHLIILLPPTLFCIILFAMGFRKNLNKFSWILPWIWLVLVSFFKSIYFNNFDIYMLLIFLFTYIIPIFIISILHINFFKIE